MVNLEKNKEYSLKLGQADTISSIYLGKKRHRNGYKHVFLVNSIAYRSHMAFRFYLGNTNKTTFEKGIVKIKEPTSKWIRPLERELIRPLLDRLKNQ